MENNQSLSIAFKQVSEILKYIPKEEYEKISDKFLNLIENTKDENYKYSINSDEDLANQGLTKEAQAVLGILFLKYWANDEEKKEAYKKLNENENKYIQEQNEKYSIDNIFKKTEPLAEEQVQENNLPVKYHEGILGKIVGFFKRLFKLDRK